MLHYTTLVWIVKNQGQSETRQNQSIRINSQEIQDFSIIEQGITPQIPQFS